MNYTPIGRVRPIHRGTHDPSAAYEALDVVRRADGLASYMAKQAVPAGKTLADGEYWGLLSDAGVKAVADAACAPFEASGGVAECHPVAGYPLEVRSGIELVQSGSGDPSPDNVRPISGWTGVTLTRCGKNLINPQIDTDNYYASYASTNADGSITVSNASSSRVYPVTVWTRLPSGTYTAKFTRISGSDPTDVYLQRNVASDYSSNIATLGVKTFTLSEETQVRFMVIADASASYTASIQIEQGSAATAYEPYQGDAYTADFGQTVYGGTLDWLTGVLTVEWASVQFMPTAIAAYGSAGYSMLSANNLQPIAASSDFYSVCDRFKRNYVWQTDAEYYYVTNDFVYLFSNRWTTLEEAKTWFTDNPTIMVYKLATPITIQLSPATVAALKGVNTLHTDADSVSVAYTASGWEIVNDLSEINDVSNRLLAQQAAAQQAIDQLATAITVDSDGAHFYKPGYRAQNEVRIDQDSVDILVGGSVNSSFVAGGLILGNYMLWHPEAAGGLAFNLI